MRIASILIAGMMTFSTAFTSDGKVLYDDQAVSLITEVQETENTADSSEIPFTAVNSAAADAAVLYDAAVSEAYAKAAAMEAAVMNMAAVNTAAVMEAAATEPAAISTVLETAPVSDQFILTVSGSAWNGETWITAQDFSWLFPLDRESARVQKASYIWSGPCLNNIDGINYGPSGKESYYNLNMSKVVSNMHDYGFSGEYWVRDDGVKMFGPYIMCAANLSVHPRGSLVECSLGTCIVCDTGDFAKKNPTMLDIAVTW